MDTNTILGLLALGCALVAAYCFVRMRSESARVDELAHSADQLEAELKTTRSKLEKRIASLTRTSEQDADVRRKLDKAKRRAAKARDEQRHGSDETKQLQSQLRLREADLKSLREELERVAGTVHNDNDKKRIKAQDEELAKLRETITRLTARADKAETAASGNDEASAKTNRELARVRHKLATHEKLYLAIHGELGAKKDRLRSLTEENERLRALKVAIVDPLPDSALPDAETPVDSLSDSALPDAETPVDSHLAIDLEPEASRPTSG